MSVSRENLYDEVWAEPMTTVAKRYAVSSSFLARVCERLGVPRPPRGYWAQRAVGIEVEKEALPDPEPGSDLEWVRDGSKPRTQPLAATATTESKTTGERPATHSLLRNVRADFEHTREGRDGQYLRPYKRELVDVFVSKEFLGDALAFANDLFLALHDRGYRVMLAPDRGRSERVAPEVCEGRDERYGDWSRPGRWRPSCPTVVLIGDISIGLCIFEVNEEIEVRYVAKLSKYVRLDAVPEILGKGRRPVLDPRDWTTRRWMPSGRIGLLAYSTERGVDWKRYWREPRPGELRGSIESIRRELKRAVPAIKELTLKRDRDAEEAARKWEIQKREWERQEAERRRVELEAQREKDIADVVTRFRMARDVRAYVAEVQAVVRDAGMEFAKDGDSEQEIQWALAYADRIDPLRAWRDDIASAEAAEKGQPCPKCGQIHRSADEHHVAGDPSEREGDDATA